MIFLEIIMVIPRLARSVPDLHEAHPALDEATCDEHLATLQGVAVEIANVLRLF